MNDPILSLKIRFLGIEASAGGRFAIVAVVLIVIIALAPRFWGDGPLQDAPRQESSSPRVKVKTQQTPVAE